MSGKELWANYVRHFSFTQLGWLFAAFQEDSENDMIMDSQKLESIVEEWIGHQWPCILQKANKEIIADYIGRRALPFDFEGFVEFLADYQEKHIELEEHAGFETSNLDALQGLYDMHNSMSPGDGLKGKALFTVLDDLGVQFYTKEERQWYVDVTVKFDRDMSGTINFVELCQIIRKVQDMEEDRVRKRQFELIQQSCLPFHEVEDWNHLFISKDVNGIGELTLSEVKSLITGLGVKWDKDVSDKIMVWISESDHNQNGTIDFGEFCLIISRMWAANMNDIRGAARDLVKDRAVSLKSVHGTYLAANRLGEVSAHKTEATEGETFSMKKNENGNVCLQSCYGSCLTVNATNGTDVSCKGDFGTQFKIATLEDERIVLTASTSSGGNLFIRSDGSVNVSDGNPADVPFTYFSIVSHEELHKKCWSKSLRKHASSSAAQARRKSKDMSTPREDVMLCPGIAQAVGELDAALETKANSARGLGFVPGPTPHGGP